MKLLITGDFFIADEYKNTSLPGKSVKDLFDSADLRIINLEAPITKNIVQNKILKTGPHLRLSEKTLIPFINNLNIDIVTLANNHILDYGNKGLADTIQVLNQQKISSVGAGNNVQEASKVYNFEKNNLSIAILNFAENEWSTTSGEEPGVNPLDIIDNAKQIYEAKKTHDKVICIIHGGHEYYNLPSPRMQKQYRFYVDQGADAIIGHHTHCISGFEIYKKAPIYYSLGNFIFTIPSNFSDWYMGIVLELRFDSQKNLKVMPHFVKQDENNFAIELMNGEELLNIKNQFNQYSDIISNEHKLFKKWNDFIIRKEPSYLSYWSSNSFIKNKYFKALLNKLGIKLQNKTGLSLYYNLLRCEAHADLSKEIINKFLKK